jgi:hypothetical protein
MIFGDRFDAARDVEPALWVAERCRGAWGTVGALVPNDYPSVVRLHAPDQDLDDWWGAYRRLFDTVAAFGEQHTASPETAWFAVWEGHGFASGTRMYVWTESGHPDAAARGELEAERARWLEEDNRRRAEVRDALAVLPRFHVPHRTHFLLSGPVDAVVDLCEPGSPERWQRPDLFWPDDRRWFVATDVDFWSLYVAGTPEFVADVAHGVDVPTEMVTFEHSLEAED